MENKLGLFYSAIVLKEKANLAELSLEEFKMVGKSIEPYYIQLLSFELKRRKVKNPRYSLRAFANQIGLDPSALSRILSGKQEISVQTALKVILKVKFSDEEKRAFLASIAEDRTMRAASLLAKAVNLTSSDLLSTLQKSHYSGNLIQDQSILKAENILQGSPDIFYLIDRQGRYLYVNLAGAHVINKSPSEMVGKTGRELGLPEYFIREMEAPWEVVFSTGKPVRVEICYQFLSHPSWYERLITPVFDSEQKVVAVMSNARDITDKKIADERHKQLLDSEKKAREVAEQTTLKMNQIQAIATSMAILLSLSGTAERILDQFADRLKAACGTVYIRRRQGFELLGSFGLDPSLLHVSEALTNIFPYSEAILTLRPSWYEPAESIKINSSLLNPFLKCPGLKRIGAVPLVVNDVLVGVLGLGFPEMNPLFHDDSAFMLAIANQFALALERARLFAEEKERREQSERIQQTLLSTLELTGQAIAK